MIDRTSPRGTRVLANVAENYPSDYAHGVTPKRAVTVPATVWCAEGDAGIGWALIQLEATSDEHPQVMSEYVHIPLDRLTPCE